MSEIKTGDRLHQLEVAMKSAQVDISNLARLMEMNRQALIKLESEHKPELTDEQEKQLIAAWQQSESFDDVIIEAQQAQGVTQ